MSVKEKAKTLVVPMPGAQRPVVVNKPANKPPELLDVRMMKGRPKKKSASRLKLRQSNSAPDVSMASESPKVEESPPPAAPGKISIGELRQLALQEKERAEREKAEKATAAVASPQSKSPRSPSPRPPVATSKIDDLLALNAQLNKPASPPKLLAPTPTADEKKQRKKKGSRKKGISKSSSAVGADDKQSDMEEESSSETGGASAVARPASPASGEKKVTHLCVLLSLSSNLFCRPERRGRQVEEQCRC